MSFDERTIDLIGEESNNQLKQKNVITDARMPNAGQVPLHH